MSSMKRVRLAFLFLIAAALLAGTPALAAGSTRTGSVELTPVGDEPGASGHASFSTWRDPRSGNWWCSGRVSCEGLRPGVLYQIRLIPQPGDTSRGTYATASQDGRVDVLFQYPCKGLFWGPRGVSVNRYQYPASPVVLSGTIVWR
jgi:hypothetical protein